MATKVEDCTTIRIEDVEDSLKDALREMELYEGLTHRLDNTEEVRLPWECTLSTNSPGTCKSRTDQHVQVSATSPPFGGLRLWFDCPTRERQGNCDGRVGTLHRPPEGKKFFCRSCWDLTYKCRLRPQSQQDLVEVFSREAEAIRRFRSEVPTRDRLRAVYDAKRRAHRASIDGWYDEGSDPDKERTFPSFDKWTAELTEKVNGQLRGRPYGRFGRCDAEAKTRDERCRQPAVDEHGKCYYHGGAT